MIKCQMIKTFYGFDFVNFTIVSNFGFRASNFPRLCLGAMENYPSFRRAMFHLEADSYALLTRLPVVRIATNPLDLHA